MPPEVADCRARKARWIVQCWNALTELMCMPCTASSRQRLRSRNPLSALPSPAPSLGLLRGGLRCHRSSWAVPNEVMPSPPHCVRRASAAPIARRSNGRGYGPISRVKIGGSRLFPERVVTLLLSGVHLRDIPARLRASEHSSTPEFQDARRRSRSRDRGVGRRRM